MLLLAIETSTRQLGVAVLDGQRLLASYELLADYPHAVELPAAVTRVLQAAGLTLPQVDAMAVDIGPGSFTGLRIGLAFVKALAFGSTRKIIGVPSLDVLANGLVSPSLPVCPILDAKQKNVYAALYRMQDGALMRQGEFYLGPLEGFLPQLVQGRIVLGDGAALYRERILAHCPDVQLAPPEAWLPRAATLGRLAQERLARGQSDDPATLVPLYLYPLDCSVRGPNRPTAVLPQPASTT